MAKHVHLIRHGEVHNPENLVYAALNGFGLSEVGRRQAVATSRYVSSAPIVAVWSSPLQRALETAEPIARRAGLHVSVDADLIEWRMLDEWAGDSWDALPTIRPGELEAYLRDPTQLEFAAETLESLAERITGAIRVIESRYADGDVVIVSHQDPVQAARLVFSGRSLRSLNTDKPRHGSVTTLNPADGWREVDSWTPDLE